MRLAHLHPERCCLLCQGRLFLKVHISLVQRAPLSAGMKPTQPEDLLVQSKVVGSASVQSLMHLSYICALPSSAELTVTCLSLMERLLVVHL